jgi:hypothetical protein
MRRAARVDNNLTEIVEAFRRLGCSVYVLNGVCDLIVGFGGLSMLVEVKDGAKSPSRRKLTPAQIKFRETWTGGVRLVEDLAGVEETAKLLMAWKRRLAA